MAFDDFSNNIPRDQPVTEVRLRHLGREERGLIGFASIVLLESFFLNDIRILRRPTGEVFLAYPTRKTSTGERHHIWHPISKDAGRLIQNAVLEQFRNATKGKTP